MQTITNTVLTLFLGGAGLWFFLKGGIVFLRRPDLLFSKKKEGKKQSGSISGFSALCITLGGTIGVGNTIGVASAVCLGGAGSIFWMWVSATLGVALKYAEVYLACLHRDARGFGGAHILLKKQKKEGLAKLFCLSCLAVSFGMGNLAQSGAAAASLKSACGISPPATGVTLGLLCLFIFQGGIRRLSRFSVLAVPVSSLCFFILCFCVLVGNHARLPDAVIGIFKEAFQMRAAVGGFFASAFCRGLTAGFSRGIFSNEAGLGSAPLVHSEAQNTPEEQGIWGAREVFLDTHVVCTLTALCLLSSPVYLAGERNPANLCAAVFEEALGPVGGAIFSVNLFFFAAASILAWGYYGKAVLPHAFRTRHAFQIYLVLFFAATILGSLFELSFLFLLCDVANAAMALINLYTLFTFRRDLRFPYQKKTHCLQFVHKSILSYGTIYGDEGE